VSHRVAAAVAALLGACATPLSEERVELAHVRQRWLPAITEGKTPVGAIEQAFGPPTASFEAGRVRCWTLMLVEKGLKVAVDEAARMRADPIVVRSSGAARTERRAALDADGQLRAVTPADQADRALWPVWREAEFHLVAVVDEEGLVARWSFTRALP
jgi:hypothetical protein